MRRTLRRWAAFDLLPVFLPRAAPRSAKPSAPIIVAGYLGTASGLGESARLCLKALRALGLEAYGWDLSGPRLRQPCNSRWQGESYRGTIPNGATLIIHVNPPVLPLALFTMGLSLPARCRVIGYWAWELPTVPASWRKSLRFVHEVWVPSRFTAAAIEAIATVPVRVVPHPVALSDLAVATPIQTGGPFRVLCVFNMASSFARKNPMAALAAFVEAFGDDPDAELIFQVSHAEASATALAELRQAARPNIRIETRMLDRSELSLLIAGSDAVISLHRSEGFGLVLAEAMLAEVPVIATAWSGNTDFIDEDCAVPIPYRLIPAADAQGLYDAPESHWAEPDTEAAARALRRLRRSPDEHRALAVRGRERAVERFGLANYEQAVAPGLPHLSGAATRGTPTP